MTVSAAAKLQLLTDVLIVQTWPFEHLENGTYWEVHVARQPVRKLGIHGHECLGCTVVVTRDADVAKRAHANESHLQRFHVQWVWGTQPDGTKCRVLIGLEAL